MSSSNSTTPISGTMELNTLALNIIQDSNLGGGVSTVGMLSLSSFLFGILTMLCLTSIYFLIRQGSITRTNGKLILLSTILLYVSTAIYMAALIWEYASGSRLISGATDGLFSPTYDGREVTTFLHGVHQQSWMMTIALAVNILIGDAVVWWRTYAIWQRKIVVRIGLLLLTFTLENAYAQASVSLSLATNVLATSLIAYKAWKHRQLWKQDLVGVKTSSQVFKALALLIESGCIYCVLLVIVIIYQVFTTSPASTFTKFGAYFTYGCLVPLVAIYPTVIIVLVALKRSPIDTGVRQARARSSEGGVSMTIEFHQSTFYSSADADAESATDSEGVKVDGSGSPHLLKPSTGEGESKASEDLV